MQIRVLKQLLFGALEQAIVNKIKPNQSSEQTDVRQGQFVSTQVTRTPQVNIQHVQCIKQLIHCLVIRVLALGKSTPAQKARIITAAFGSLVKTESLKRLVHKLIQKVSNLFRYKSIPVNSIIYIGVNYSIPLLNLILQTRRREIQIWVSGQSVKL